MLRSLETVEKGEIDPDRVIDRITLDLDGRRRRRQTLACEGGTHVLVDLPAVPGLRGGDGLRLENGDIIEINAAPEPLIEVTPTAVLGLARIAWHLGNRHLPVQFVGRRFAFGRITSSRIC